MTTDDTSSGHSFEIFAASSTANDDPYIVVATTQIDQLTQVRIYQSTLREKIFPEHPEVEVVGEEGIVEALENPSLIMQSTTRPGDTVVFVTEQTSFNGRPLHVPVRIIEGTSGRLASSYFCDTNQSAVKLWPKE